jgi:hypothetical protein
MGPSSVIIPKMSFFRDAKDLTQASIQIQNIGAAPATTITYLFLGGNADRFRLENTVNTLNNGESTTFSVHPRTDNMSIGTFSTTIEIRYSDDDLSPLRIPVSITIDPLFAGSGIAANNIDFNSNSLINIPSPTMGWYAKAEYGRWMKGHMVNIPESVIEIPVTNQLFAFNDLNKLDRDISGNLKGGIGRWWTERTVPRQGPPAPSVKIHVQLNIKNDGYDVWMYARNDLVGGQQVPARRKFPDANGWIFIQNGTGDHFINIRIRALSQHSFEEDLVLGHPVFQSGNMEQGIFTPNNTYFWQDIGGENRWNLQELYTSQVNFLDFVPKEPYEQGTIIIRALDLSEDGVYFMPNAAGQDKQVTSLSPTHYLSLAPVSDLIIDGVKVGTVDVRLIEPYTNKWSAYQH